MMVWVRDEGPRICKREPQGFDDGVEVFDAVVFHLCQVDESEVLHLFQDAEGDERGESLTVGRAFVQGERVVVGVGDGRDQLGLMGGEVAQLEQTALLLQDCWFLANEECSQYS